MPERVYLYDHTGSWPGGMRRTVRTHAGIRMKRMNNNANEMYTGSGASEFNAEFSVNAEPCFSLSEQMSLRSREDIEALCAVLGAENREEAEKWLTQPENLKMILLAIPKDDFLLFCRAAKEPFIDDGGVMLPRHSGALMFCLMTAFKTDRGIFIVVPTEIKQLWRDLDRTDFSRYKLSRDTLDGFAVACAKLYGALPLEELCEIFGLRSDYGRITPQQAREMLDGLDDGQGYIIADGMILHPTARPELAQQYIRARSGIERYLPDREKLEQLGEGDYYEIFRELELYRLSVQDGLGESKAMAMVDSLYMLLAAELYGPFVRTEFFRRFGLKEDKQLVDSLKKKVRQWRLYGHTAEELE